MTYFRTEEADETGGQEWRAAGYVRLSKEDGDKPESDSIQNQKKILENHVAYLRRQGERIVSFKIYSDDGFAGGNFDRPGYRSMMADVEQGAVNCIIFKDSSRLGRNYPELGRLMEEYFPQQGVRVISVLNSLDSVRSPESYCSALVSFSNIVNDDYIRQLSLKIKSTLNMKRKNGEYIGNYAPYGYVKSPEDRHKLAVDPGTAQTVRQIFSWYGSGLSISGIAKRLSALGIPTPSEEKTRRGCGGFEGKGQTWSPVTIRAMLQNEVYIGNLVQGKQKSASYRTKRMVSNPQSKWIVTEHAHEAIVSEEAFSIAHDRLARHVRTAPKKEEVSLFSGLIYCGSCGRKMTRCSSNGRPRWRCPTRTCAPEICPMPSWSEARVYALVLGAVQEQVGKLVDAEAALAGAERRKPAGCRGVSDELRLAEREQARLEEAQFTLYDRFQSGGMDEEDYRRFSARYGEKIRDQQMRAAQLRSRLETEAESRCGDDAFVDGFRRRGTVTVLDSAAASRLIDRIVLLDNVHAEIYFRFSDEIKKRPGAAKPLRALEELTEGSEKPSVASAGPKSVQGDSIPMS